MNGDFDEWWAAATPEERAELLSGQYVQPSVAPPQPPPRPTENRPDIADYGLDQP